MKGGEYTFEGKLGKSQGQDIDVMVEKICRLTFPGIIKVTRAKLSDDKLGVDYWLHYPGGHKERVDLKSREEDCQNYNHDDIALETWSVKENKKIGWTLDPTKQTTWTLHLWKDTGRWQIFPFRLLLAAFQRRAEEWCTKFDVREQGSNGSTWHSECVYVPRKVIWQAIYAETNPPQDKVSLLDANQILSLTDKKLDRIARQYRINRLSHEFHECGDTIIAATTAFTALRDMHTRLSIVNRLDPEWVRVREAINNEILKPSQKVFPVLMTNFIEQTISLQTLPHKPKKYVTGNTDCIQDEIWRGIIS